MTVTTTIPIPTIALAADTGTGAGADSDGITNNGLVNVTGLVAGATWKHTIKGTTIDALASSVITFTLPEGVYEVSEVQVVQTLNSVDSAPAMFAMQITVDTAAPVIALEGDASVSHAHGTDYTDAGVSGVDAAAGETLETVITDSDDAVVGAVDPNTPGDYTITYTATDRAGNEATLTRIVTVSEPVAVDTLALPDPPDQNYTVDTAVDVTLPAATGGTGTLTYTLTGALQAGLSYTAASRTLSGTPTVAATTTLTYTVTDSAAPAVTAMQTFTVIVNDRLVLTTVDNQNYTVDTAITDLVLPEATGGTAPRSYSLTGHPAGLNYDGASRTLSGTPSTAASATELTYTVTDANGASASQTFNVAVAAAPSLSTDATLSGLTIAEGGNDVPLDQTFASGTLTGYTATVANNVDSITVTLTTTDSAARVEVAVEGAQVAAGTGGVTANVTLDRLGAFGIDIEVTAEDGTVATQTYTVTVTRAENIAPTADAGQAQTDAVPGTFVTLDGSASNDPDGDNAALTYAWTHTLTDDTMPSTPIVLATTATPTFTPTTAGVYTFALTVTDAGTPPTPSTNDATVVITAMGEDVTLPATPTIALATDTGAGVGADSDGITSDGVVNVTLATGATWKHIINGTPTTVIDSGTTTFTLEEGVYADGKVQVVQTVSGVDSAPGEFGMQITVDTTAPTVATFDTINEEGTVGTAQTHPIIFSEAVTGLVAGDFTVSSLVAPGGDIEVNDVTDSGDHTTYTLTFTPAVPTVAFSLTLPIASVADLAGNTGPAMAAMVTGAAVAPASTDATLSGLTIAEGGNDVPLDQAFVSGTLTGYTATVPNNVASVMVMLTKGDTGATTNVTVNTGASGGDTASEVIDLEIGANSISIVVTAEDASTQTYTVTVTRTANTAPRITAGSAALNYQESEPGVVEDYDATDDEGNTITWSVGGTDASLFAIDTNGVLTFRVSPNFEVPTDNGADRVYDLTIIATDDGTPTMDDTLDVTVTVTNVDEPGAIGPITGIVQVGQVLTAGAVTDPDGAVSVINDGYTWQSAGVDNVYTPISGATTTSTYTPDAADVDKTIRVIATYTDGHGSGKAATSAATGAVAAASVTLSMDSTLSALDVSAGTLNPAFASGTLTGYTATVANNVDSITVTPTVTDTGKATVTVDGVAVTSGEASAAIDLTLGENPIDIIVTAEDASTQTYTVTVTRAVPAPGIALRRDTGVNDVDNADRITRNRDIDVTLASGATWEFSSNSGTGGYATGSGTSFSLPNGVYVNGQVRVRQTVNGVTSKLARLDAFTFDADVPTVTLGSIAGAVIDQGGQTHVITFTENVLGLATIDFSPSTGITVTAVSGSDGGTDYTITYTATAASFNLRLAEGGVSDIAGNSVALTSKTGTATPHNTAPTINTGNETPSHAENTPIATAVATYTTDDTNAIAWSHAGTDASFFDIATTATGGVLTFKASPNYETPGSAATSNAYSVTITATETNGVPSNLASAPLTVTVTVTNVDEPGAISAIGGTAQVGQTLAAGAVTDEDSPADGTPVSSITYQWQSAVEGTAADLAVGDSAWPPISGATGATYEPAVGDVDKIIRVVATYTDGESSGKKVASAPTDPVVSETAPVVPTIALADDTGTGADDGITMNGQVDVTLAAGATAWAYTIKDGTATTVIDTSVTFFILPEGVYAVSEVQVVQTVSSVDSAPARLSGAVTVDRTKPVITVDPGAVEVTQGSGTYNDQGVTVDTGETLATVITDSSDVVVGAVDTDTLGDYTYTYTATDLAGNVSDSVTRTVTVSPAKSTVATLSGLTIAEGSNDVALDQTFASGTLTGYTATVANNVDSITVTPTVTDTGKATVTVNGDTVVSGQPSAAIALNVGNNSIPVVVTAEDASTQTYTVTVARAVPPPGIALRKDTAVDDGVNNGVNTDRITRNRDIDVTLHADFQDGRDTWEWSQDSGNAPYTTGSNIDPSFSPGATQATYQNNVVGARQTVNGVASEFAGLAQFTHDTVKPIISLNGGGTSVTITKGDAYTDPVTASDAFDGTIDPSHIVITGGPVDINTVDDYILTYNVMDRAGNAATAVTRTVTVSEPVVTALALPAPPNQSYTVGTAVNLILPEAIGGTGALRYSLTGHPAGLNYDGASRTLSGTPTVTGTTTLTYTVTDSAPTPVVATQTFMVTVNAAADTTAPVITFNRFEPTDGIEDGGITYLNAGDTLTVFVQSDEPLAGASLTDAVSFKVGDATKAAQNLISIPNTDPAQYSAVYTVAAADNTTAVALIIDGVADADGNSVANLEIDIDNVQIDTTAPTVLDFPDLGEPTVGEPANVKITFSEAVADFASADITGATAIADSGDQTTYLVTYTPSALGTVTLTLAANAVSDLAGNTAPATNKTASGTAQAAVTETTAKPRITATITLPGLTIAEFNRGDFIAGMANFLSVEAANVHILRVTAGSVFVYYEIVADTAAALDAPAMTLSGANAAQLRTAIRQSVPATSAVSTTVVRQEADEPPAPATPTLIQGAVTDTTITLSWVAVDNAESYTVTRVVGSGNVNVPITGLTATDENLDADTEYKYTITATNSAGTSDASAEFDARTEATPTAPETPSLEKGVVTDTTVALSWGAVTGADSYTLTRTPTGGADVVVASEITDLIFSDTGLTPETDYTYSLVATNTVGSSTASEVIATTLATPTVPAAPSLEKGVVTDTTVALSWTAIPGADSYTLSRVVVGSANVVVASAITALTATDTGLTAATDYTYSLVATNTVGSSTASEVIATTLATPTVPAAPSLEKGVVTDTTVALSWGAVTGADTYTLTRTLGSGSAVTVLSDTTELTATDTGLTPETDYTYSLIAKNTVGSSTASEVIATTLATPTAPETPSLEKGVVTDTTVALSWTAILGADTYTLTRTLGSGSAEPVLSDTTALTATDTGLTAATDYTYSLTATNTVGTSAASEITARTADGPTTPAIPTLALGTTSSNSIMLSWATVTGAESYTLTRVGTGGASDVEVFSGDALTATDRGLTADTEYKYTITATNTAGTSAPSVEFTARTAILPLPPTLRAGAVTATTITLEWDAVTGADSYVIYDDSAGASIIEHAGAGISVTVTGLSPATGYTFYARSFDAGANRGSLSAGVSATTAVAPPIPAAPVLTPRTTTQNTIAFSWAAVTGAESYTLTRVGTGGASGVEVFSGDALTATDRGLDR